jgi:hypothetical protein
VASFFGFAAEGRFAESMHAAAPDEQPWMPSRVDWQSVFFPHAAAGFEQVLSTHWPQSVLPNDGDGGGAASVAAELELVPADVSAAEADDADPVGAVSEAGDASELAAAEDSEAGLSGGLDSPPPQAIQASGTAATRTRAVTGRRGARLMVSDCLARSGIESKHELLPSLPSAPLRGGRYPKFPR